MVGVQAEGTAGIITEHTHIQEIMKLYVAKYDAGKDFYNNFRAGKNKHVLYCMTPKKFVLFDELNFPDDGRREYRC